MRELLCIQSTRSFLLPVVFFSRGGGLWCDRGFSPAGKSIGSSSSRGNKYDPWASSIWVGDAVGSSLLSLSLTKMRSGGSGILRTEFKSCPPYIMYINSRERDTYIYIFLSRRSCSTHAPLHPVRTSIRLRDQFSSSSSSSIFTERHSRCSPATGCPAICIDTALLLYYSSFQFNQEPNKMKLYWDV